MTIAEAVAIIREVMRGMASAGPIEAGTAVADVYDALSLLIGIAEAS